MREINNKAQNIKELACLSVYRQTINIAVQVGL